MNRIEGLLGGVDYHQFYLWADHATVPISYPPGGPANRLLATTATGHAVCITAGIAMGVVHLAIELLDSPPSDVDHSRDWEAVAEVSMAAAVPSATIALLMERTNPPFDGFELPPGRHLYRVRGHATGRSLDYDAVVDGVSQAPREHHLLQLWRVDRLEPPSVLRADDPWARQGPPHKLPVDAGASADQAAARQLARISLESRVAADTLGTAGAGGPPNPREFTAEAVHRIQ